MKYFLILIALHSQFSFAEDEAKYLKQGDPAPFTGFLISPDKAEKVREQAIDLESQKKINTLLKSESEILTERLTLYKDHANFLSKQMVEQKDQTFLTKVGFFVMGAVITGGIAYGVSRAVR